MNVWMKSLYQSCDFRISLNPKDFEGHIKQTLSNVTTTKVEILNTNGIITLQEELVLTHTRWNKFVSKNFIGLIPPSPTLSPSPYNTYGIHIMVQGPVW